MPILSSLVVDCDFKGEGLPSANHKVARTFEEGEAILRSPTVVLSTICVNPSFLRPGGIQFIRLAHELRPSTPLYAVHSNESSFSTIDLNRLGLTGSLARKDLGSRVMEYHEQMQNSLGQAGLLDENYWDIRFEDKLVDGYRPIRCADFISGQKCLFDVYVRLESGRFLKILSANDSFSPERVSTYIKKGVRHFYINASSLQRCLHTCDTFARAILMRGNISLELKVAQVLGDGSEIVKLIQGKEIDNQSVEQVTDYLGKVRMLLLQSAKTPKDLLDILESRLQLYEHSVGVSLVAGLLTRPLQIESETAFKSVGVASMLHDIGLAQLPPHLGSEDQTQFSATDLALFETHPEVGAEYLTKHCTLDPSVIRAIAQHHERRDGDGFPHKLGAGKISPVAEIIGISDEFVRLLRAQDPPSPDGLQGVYDKMESEIFDRFSFPIVEAFRAIFLKRD